VAACSLDATWWRRAGDVLAHPVAVFAAFGDDTDADADARSEPINAIVVLAGIASVVWAPSTGRLLDDPEIDAILVVVLLFLTGALYGFVGYFLLGALLRLGLATVGVAERWTRPRHLVAYACVPLALALVLLFVRLVVYGGDIFRRGAESGDVVFAALELGVLAWSIALLAFAVRVVYALPWTRAVAATILPALVPALAVAATLLD
jgi:hypothetical protein